MSRTVGRFPLPNVSVTVLQEGCTTMSRTRNTQPHRIQVKSVAKGRGFPYPIGGAWSGIKELRKQRERKARVATRTALARQEEPQPIRHRHSARYDLYYARRSVGTGWSLATRGGVPRETL